MTMRNSGTLSVLGAFLLSVVAVSVPAADAYSEYGDYGRDHRGFSERSIKGTYYIPCACEGNIPGVGGQDPRVTDADAGSSIHVAGMGKAEFDGKGNVTITQWNVYTEINSQIVRNVMDGETPGGQKAQLTGEYKVNAEGFGQIYGIMFPDEDDPNTPSFLITETVDHGKKAKELYMIIPQNFVDQPDPNNLPKTLIHVTARLR